MRAITSEEQAVEVVFEALEAIRSAQGWPMAPGGLGRAREVVAALSSADLLVDRPRRTLMSLDCEEARVGGVWETTMMSGCNPWLVWCVDGAWHTDFGYPGRDESIGVPQQPWLLVGRGPYIKVRLT